VRAPTFTMQCVQALHYVHSMGRLHRDIKSNNILLSAKGQVKISTL
jgi:serine/threonine protein kinase